MMDPHEPMTTFRRYLATSVLALLAAMSVMQLAPPVRAQEQKEEEQPQDDPPQDQADPGDKDPEAEPARKLAPEVQKKLDELMQQDPRRRTPESAREAARLRSEAARQKAGDRRRGPVRPGEPEAQPPSTTAAESVDEPPGDVVPLNIPAAPRSDVPPEERHYTFSIKDGSYDQLVEGFARQTGLGVLGDAPRDGKVTFVTTEELTFREALSRVRMLLFNYKPHEPYWLRYEGTNLRVIRVTDLYRELEPDRMFQSIEAMRAANLADDELALVVYTPKSGSVADLKQVRDFLPDYVRVAPLENQNGVTIFALVKDIEKYLWLIDFFTGGGSRDPRTLERLEVKYLLPSEAIEKLRQLMSLDPTGRTARAVPIRGRDVSPLDSIPEPDMTILPEDSQGFILVRAMQDKIEEMKHLLAFIDVETPIPDTPPVVIPVDYVSPEDMVAAVQQIISASEPDAAGPAPKPPHRRRSTRAPGAVGQPVTAVGITLLPHPSQPAIIVIGDEAQITRVRELVAMLDKASRVDPVKIELKYATASEVATAIMSVLGGAGGKKPTPTDFTLVSDPGESALWFTGSLKDLAKVKEMVAAIDVGGDEVTLHIVQLARQKPSFIATVLGEYDAGTAGAPTTARRGRPRMKAPLGGSKFNANDEMQRLFLICTETEWQTYKPIIDQLEELGGKGPFVRVDLKNIDPETAVEQLGAMAGSGPAAAGPFRFVPVESAVLVFGASDRQIQDIRTFIAEIDKASPIIQRTFELKFADTTEIKTALETLLGDGSTRRRRPRARAGPQAAATPVVSGDLTIVPIGNRLVIRATPDVMAEAEALIAKFDVEQVVSEIRVYDDFPPGADIDGIADTLQSFMSVGGPPVRRAARTGADKPTTAAQFLSQPASGRLVVIADPAQFPEIENLLNVLRTEVNVDPIIAEFIDVKYADPTDLVELVRPLLDLKILRLLQAGELEESAVADGTIPPKPGRRRTSRRGGDGQRYHMAANLNNTGIIVAATQKIVDEAQTLIAQFDQPAPEEDEVVFVTVPLSNADAGSMVKAINDMLGAGGRRTRPSPRKGASAAEPVDQKLTVTEAPGGAAVVLHGPKTEVEEIVGWIDHLEQVSTRGRAIKVYAIQDADVERLAELIVAAVAVSAPTAGRRPVPHRVPPGKEPEEDEFEVVKTWDEDGLYIQADLIARTMLVATTESRMAEIDDIVAKFETPPEEGGLLPVAAPVLPKRIIELKYRDPLDAAWELEPILAQLWDRPDQTPKIEAGAFGNILIVRHPDPTTFDLVEEVLRKYVDKVPPDKLELKRTTAVPPPVMSAEDAARWIQMNHPEFDVELIDTSKKAGPTYGIQRVMPPRAEPKPAPCVLPLAFNQSLNALLATLPAQEPPDEQPADDAEEQPLEEDLAREEELIVPEPIDPGPTGDEVLNAVGTQIQAETKAKEDTEPQESKGKGAATRGLEGQKLKVYFDNDTGVLLLEGAAGVVEDVPDWMDELEEEIKDFPVPPDIRIYRLKYIDVFSAQDIIEELFGVSRQQRQMIQQQQRMLQQQQRAEQVRQQRAQQQAQAQGRGQQPEGQPTGRPGQQPPQQQQPQIEIPQLPTTQVRIYPNPRDRTLILRAETNQYPAIEELLATIDQPKPLNSELRIFKLTKLAAPDVEAMLNDMLELDAPSSGEGRRRQRRAADAEPSPGAQLPRTILQELEGGTSMLAVDPDDIKLSSNEEANTIIVLAPPKAIEFIGELIKQLETEDIPERITESFELVHATAADVAEYLTEYFAQQRRLGGGGAPTGGRKSETSNSLNTPSFIPYARLNLLTVHATEEQMAEVRDIVARLDVSTGDDDWEYVTLQHADAKAVADILEAMFAAQAVGGQRKGAAAEAPGPRFIGAEGDRVLLYAAPPDLRPQIVSAIERIEAEAANQTRLRTIKLEHAKPSQVADAIQTSMGRESRARTGAARRSQVLVTGDDASKRLFVMADDTAFEQVESLAKTLDIPGEMPVDFRIYTLQYADAKKVHATMTNLITNFLRTASGVKLEPFSVEVDQRTNSLVVLGTPLVFGFVEQNLKKVDTPANAASPPGMLMVSLTNADAQEVAGNINRLWAQKDRDSTETPPQAEPNRSLNMLIVRGTQEQIDEINKQFIEPLKEQATPALTSETLTLTHADAEGVADSINRIFEDKKRAMQAIGQRGAGASPLEYTVSVTADPNTNQLIIQASDDNLAFIKTRIAELDREGVATAPTSIKIYPIKNADLNSVVNIINQWARTIEQSTRGRTPSPSDVVQASAEPATQSVVVTASESNHMIIKDLIEGVDVTSAADQRQRRVVTLKHANATEVTNQLTQVFRAAGRPRSGDPGASFVADPKTNSVIANVNEDEFADVTDLVAKIDADLPEEGKRVTEVYPLQYADPGALNTVVLNWFRWDVRSQQPPWEQVTAAVEWATQSLVVTASPQNHALIKKLVEKVDVEGTLTKSNFVRKLEHAGAEDVSQALQKVYSSRRPTRRGEQAVSITPDPATNSLLIVANQVELEEIDSLLQSLDVPPDMSLKPQIKSIKLSHADPWSVQDAVDQLFRQRSRDPREQVTAVADFASRSVVVSAWPEQMSRVEELIRQVDATEADSQQVKVINLQNAEADAVARTLNEVFVRSAPRRGGNQPPPITISAVAGAKAILVNADQVDLAEIESVVAELDREDAVGSDKVRVVPLLYGDAAEMHKSLQEMFRKPGGRGNELVGDVRISALPQSNALLISGGAELLDRIETQVREVDAASESGIVPKVIPLEHAKINQVLPTVQEMFSEQRGRRGDQPAVISGNEALNALIVKASQTDMSGIEAVVKSLDTPEAAGKPGTRLVQVAQGVNVEDLASKVETAVNESAVASSANLRGTQVPRISITPDTRSGLLILAGSPQLFDEAEKLIRTIEEKGPVGRGTRIVRIKNVPADDIQRLIDQLTGTGDGSGRSQAGSRSRPSTSRPRSTPPPRRNTRPRRP